jgi:eukaryotic-like serine/threonine-protein kinase
VRALSFTETIGAGAFGTVYKAELSSAQGFRRQVAVKVILQDHADKEMFLSRMRDEARLLGLLADDHVLKVIDLLNIGGRDAIVMEYIEGIDLSAAIDNKRLPSVRAALEIGAIVAGTLDRAHQARHPVSGEDLGVVHRDVKPANVMLTASGSLKLLDFGIAQARFAARESQTGQMVLGTLNYMAPDYIITGEVTPAIDVYGLALTLYELVVGEVYGQPKLREDQHEERLQRQLSTLQDTQPELAALLAQMLHWEPESRPNCGECAQALLDLADNMRGQGLRRWAASTVSSLLAERPSAPDQERLLGRTIQLGASAIPDPEPISAPQTPINSPVGHPSEPEDAPTAIGERASLQAKLERHTSETARPAPLAHTTAPGTTPSKAVTERVGPAHRTVPRSVMRGVLIGGAVGSLAVALLAVVLFWGFPPTSLP